MTVKPKSLLALAVNQTYIAYRRQTLISGVYLLALLGIGIYLLGNVL